MIDFYYWPTPNGWKVAILLEELGIDYRTVFVDIGTGAQFPPDFLAIRPNHRGSSTTGGKKSRVCTMARSPSRRNTPASS